MKHGLRGAFAAGFLVIANAAPAQTDAARGFPSRPVRIIVGYSAGGGNDIIARIVAQKLSENLGQSVVVETSPGSLPSSPPSTWRRRRPTATPC